MSKFQQCPHCFTEVLVRTDHSCPRCNKNTFDIPAHGIASAALTIQTFFPMPLQCYNCGKNTDKSKTYTYKVVPGHPNEDEVTTPIQMIMHWLVYRVMKRKIKFKVRLSVCASCSSSTEPKPLEIIPERDLIRLPVHKSFYTSYMKLNGDD